MAARLAFDSSNEALKHNQFAYELQIFSEIQGVLFLYLA